MVYNVTFLKTSYEYFTIKKQINSIKHNLLPWCSLRVIAVFDCHFSQPIKLTELSNENMKFSMPIQ